MGRLRLPYGRKRRLPSAPPCPNDGWPHACLHLHCPYRAQGHDPKGPAAAGPLARQVRPATASGLMAAAGLPQLALLRALELECEHDFGDAAEQCQQPGPDDQQRGAVADQLLGGPEADQDLQDARYHAKPPGAVDDPGFDRRDEDEGPLQDQQQPDDGGQGPEGAERIDECPDRSGEEDDPHQDMRPPPVWPHQSEQDSFTIVARKITPRRTPTVAADVTVNRSTITETISHAIPVNSNIHHGPASRHRRARTEDLLSSWSRFSC